MVSHSPINLNDFYKAARDLLPVEMFDFIEGGSGDEHSLKRNISRIQDIFIMPRMLRGFKTPQAEIEILGDTLQAPILMGPTAYQCLVSPKGELDMLDAANHFKTLFVVSMFSSTDYALLAQRAQVPLWMQMYFLKDRSANVRFLKLVESLGYEAIVLTVDAPVYGKREKEIARPLVFPSHISFQHLTDLGIPFGESVKNRGHFSSLLEPSLSWNDIKWLGETTSLPIILKGILDPRDTEVALKYPNVKGIIVSNHGGRQLDGVPSAFDVIEEHRKIIGNRALLFLDGGISRGSDVFKACALGADAVLLGRASLWALAAGGAQGVIQALTILKDELLNVMHLAGCERIQDILRDSVRFENEITRSFQAGDVVDYNTYKIPA